MKSSVVMTIALLMTLSSVVLADSTTVSSDKTVHQASQGLPKDKAKQDRRNDRVSDRKLKAERENLKTNTQDPHEEGMTR